MFENRVVATKYNSRFTPALSLLLLIVILLACRAPIDWLVCVKTSFVNSRWARFSIHKSSRFMHKSRARVRSCNYSTWLSSFTPLGTLVSPNNKTTNELRGSHLTKFWQGQIRVLLGPDPNPTRSEPTFNHNLEAMFIQFIIFYIFLIQYCHFKDMLDFSNKFNLVLLRNIDQALAEDQQFFSSLSQIHNIVLIYWILKCLLIICEASWGFFFSFSSFIS